MTNLQMHLTKILKNEQAKSLYRSRAGSHFYGTEYDIWAVLGPVCNAEKKIWPIMSNF